jgi:hypothetical protein
VINESAQAHPPLRLEDGAVSELHGIARFTFHDGKLEEFKRLSAQCVTPYLSL